MRHFIKALLAPLGLFLCLSNAFAATWYVCPPTDAQGAAVTHGTADGTSAANCFAGAVDAWATAGDIDAGDTVEFAAGEYYEKHIVGDSGTAGSRITLNMTGAVWSDSLRLDNNYTIATDKSQTTGSSWTLVSNGIYKKGMGNYAYILYVNNVWQQFMTPHKTTEADVLANIDPGEWAIITKTTDGFVRTMYYRGTPTDYMRVNNVQASTTSTWYQCAFCLVGTNYITLNGGAVKQYFPNALSEGALFVENTTGVIVDGMTLTRNRVGFMGTGNTNLIFRNNTSTYQVASGLALSATHTLALAGDPNQIVSISVADPGVVTTAINHGLATNDYVYFESLSGMSQLTGEQRQVTVTGATTFTISSTVGYSAYTGLGKLMIQRTDTNTLIKDNVISYNGTEPSYNGINVTWQNDNDGIGIGYRGGTMNGLIVEGNDITYNGPQRLMLTGENGDQERGRGIFIGTSERFNLAFPIFRSNWFKNNHWTSLGVSSDTDNALVYGNIFAGVVAFNADPKLQLEFNGLPLDAVTLHQVFNNTFTGTGGLYVNNVADLEVDLYNNIFYKLLPLQGSSLVAAITFNQTTANFDTGKNDFYDVDGDRLYRVTSTTYTTIASFNSATGEAVGDLTVDPLFTGGASPSNVADFRLSASSTLRRAGVDLNIGNVQDQGNRAFLHPPSIGAWEATGGDPSLKRTLR